MWITPTFKDAPVVLLLSQLAMVSTQIVVWTKHAAWLLNKNASSVSGVMIHRFWIATHPTLLATWVQQLAVRCGMRLSVCVTLLAQKVSRMIFWEDASPLGSVKRMLTLAMTA
jgi:hypothetical protein